ncbi:MAG TPA: CHAP domain-containing protein [Rhodopila sp.]|nr:CHAP domain-containing protein [Rhodopila sp.]
MSSTLLLSCTVFAANADAAHHNRVVRTHATESHHAIASHHSIASHHARPLSTRMAAASHGRFVHHAMHLYGRRFATRYHGISCVPYAREVSGIEVAGNAWQWWDNAEGRYARGDLPEAGSVLNFRANGRMRLGHVAVVSRVVNPREIMVDHANWPGGGGRGGISRDVAVVDVSEANNWSAVRVELGRGGEFGSIYPTYGFIYDRPDVGHVIAAVTRPAAPLTAMNQVPSDLRPAAERPWHIVEEVAEAPDTPNRKIDLSVPAASLHLGK